MSRPLDSLTDAEAAALVRTLPDDVLAAYVRRGDIRTATAGTPTGRILHALELRGLLHLAQAVAAEHFVTLDAICGRCRTRPVARARADVWLAMRQTGLSYPAIGALFERDHSSVLLAVRGAARLVTAHPRPAADDAIAV